jgi:competence protein ComEC
VLLKEIPFIRIVVPLCAGILSGVYAHPGRLILVSVTVVAITGLVTSLFFNKYLVNFVYGASLSVLLVFAGHLFYRTEKGKLSTLDQVSREYICTVSEYPELRGKSLRVIARLRYIESKITAKQLHGSMLIYFKTDPRIMSFVPGDILKLKCTPQEIVNRGNPYEFDYRFYMENQGIRYYAFSGINDITGYYSPENRTLSQRALITRKRIISMYEKRGINGSTLAIVAAITLGERSLLDEEQRENFSKAGIMHLMAVSGLHAVILSMFVFNLLFFMKGKLRPLRSLIAILFLWSFAFITGFTPSVVRATIMFSFFQGGKLMRRDLNSLNSVFASAFLLLMIRPSVIFDTGFLLSYLAVIFIICFYKDLYLQLDVRNPVADRIWQSAIVSTVATAGTLPVTVTAFNRFPTYFLLANIIIVPIGSFLIILGCLVLLTYPAEPVSMLFAGLLRIMTGVTGILTEKAASLPFSTIEKIGLARGEAILLGVFLFIFLRFISDRRKIFFIYPLAAMLGLVAFGTVKDIRCRMSDELIVYNTLNAASVGIRTGKILNLYSDKPELQPEVLKHCATQGLKPALVLIGERNILLKAGENRVLITRSVNKSQLEKTKPDYIIISGSTPFAEEILRTAPSVKAVIFTGALVQGYAVGRIPSSDFKGIIHYVRKSGSVRIKI